jgi:hypothetical protein
MPGLREKIISIICEEWPTPDGYLLGFDIYERLTAGCIDTELSAVRRTLGRSERSHIESAHVHHAMRVTSTETRCENSFSSHFGA